MELGRNWTKIAVLSPAALSFCFMVNSDGGQILMRNHRPAPMPAWLLSSAWGPT